MKEFWKLAVAFVSWCCIILLPFALIVLCLAGITVTKPVLVIVCTLIIVCAVLVKVFDSAFAKKVTSATGK